MYGRYFFFSFLSNLGTMLFVTRPRRYAYGKLCMRNVVVASYVWWATTVYSLRPKIIVHIPGYFCPKMIILTSLIILSQNECPLSLRFIEWHQEETFDTGLDIRGSKSSILEVQSHHQEDDFWHRNFRGCFKAVAIFYFERHTYNYSLNGERALILPKLEIRTIISGLREYMTRTSCRSYIFVVWWCNLCKHM